MPPAALRGVEKASIDGGMNPSALPGKICYGGYVKPALFRKPPGTPPLLLKF